MDNDYTKLEQEWEKSERRGKGLWIFLLIVLFLALIAYLVFTYCLQTHDIKTETSSDGNVFVFCQEIGKPVNSKADRKIKLVIQDLSGNVIKRKIIKKNDGSEINKDEYKIIWENEKVEILYKDENMEDQSLIAYIIDGEVSEIGKLNSFYYKYGEESYSYLDYFGKSLFTGRSFKITRGDKNATLEFLKDGQEAKIVEIPNSVLDEIRQTIIDEKILERADKDRKLTQEEKEYITVYSNREIFEGEFDSGTYAYLYTDDKADANISLKNDLEDLITQYIPDYFYSEEETSGYFEENYNDETFYNSYMS